MSALGLPYAPPNTKRSAKKVQRPPREIRPNQGDVINPDDAAPTFTSPNSGPSSPSAMRPTVRRPPGKSASPLSMPATPASNCGSRQSFGYDPVGGSVSAVTG